MTRKSLPGLVPFVERKELDWATIQDALKPSADSGRWANFGPAESRLADVVADRLALPSDRTVVPASSATAALFAVAGAFAAKAGRHLNWAVSAYGFYSTAVGPLAAGVRVVDCDAAGMLDIAALAALPTEAWDGVIVTDIFGSRPDLTPYAELCAVSGKPLIVDAALSFPARRGVLSRGAEVISFHHTKPWGFGEGGCAVVQREMAATVRSFLNFCVGASREFASYAANGKMSDLAAAAIAHRVSTMEDWSQGYRNQRCRIVGFARSAGLSILAMPPADAVTPHVPVLMSSPAPLDDLPRAPFAYARYYKPLSENCLTANAIYSRIVNVPCHPGMTAVESDAIRAFFASLAGASPQCATRRPYR